MRADYERRLGRVLDHIFDHPAGDLSLDALADVAAMSRFHWHRVFLAMTGETTAQAVRRIRLGKASMALVHSQASVSQIARDVGYPNLASFTRAFSEAYGAPPAAFRRKGVYRPLHHSFRKGTLPMHPVEILETPALRLAALPHRGDFNAIGRSFEKLWASLAPRGLAGQVGPMVGVFYDNPAEVAKAALRSHAGVIVGEDFPIAAPLQEVRLAGGRHAVLHHAGPYASLAGAYDALYCGWLPDSGCQPAEAPAYEVYLNGPENTAPEALRTDIHLPLA